jgi:hypothetical protein
MNEDYERSCFSKKIILTGSESAEDVAESIHELEHKYFQK